MAGGRHGRVMTVPPAQQYSSAKKKSMENVHLKRLELEQEVDNLQKMLDQEEKVHQFLERALQSIPGSTLHIPSFLPKKTKELLAELAMVEQEIARLEGEISKIQGDVTSETQDPRRAIESSTRYKHVSGPVIPVPPPHLHSSVPTPVRASESRRVQKKLALETKSMFFINQAIRGDYTVTNGFDCKGKSGNLLGGATDKKENQSVLSSKISRKSWVIEKPSSSPKLPPKHTPLKAPLGKEEDVPLINLTKESPFISSIPTEKSINSQSLLQPNKLSERIMKCLVCIFLRLIRTSRAMELEKSSSVVSRSMGHLSLSRSFHFEGSLNPYKTSLTAQPARQDPYGIFEIEDSLLRDIGPYKNLVRFTSNSLDVKGISNSVPLLRNLRALIDSLQEVDLRSLTHQQKLAFWINIYNTCIMHGFLEHGLPSNPEKVSALRNSKAVLNIGGNKLNALAIEHFILRQPSNMKEVNWKGEKDDREDAVRRIYGLEHPEPNIAFALCSGSRSSPAVRIYTADGVAAELEKAKLEYLQASIVVTAARKLVIPELLLWNVRDFASDLGTLLEWVCNQLPTSGSLRKSMAECLRGQGGGKSASEIINVDVMPYEFEFQCLLFM